MIELTEIFNGKWRGVSQFTPQENVENMRVFIENEDEMKKNWNGK